MAVFAFFPPPRTPRRRAAEDRERRVRAALAVTEELHAKQQEAARKEAERAARKAPQDAAGPDFGCGSWR